MKIIDNKKEIFAVQKKFEAKFKVFADEEIQTVVGYPGGHLNAKVFWSNKLNFWSCFKKFNDRYWNAFGTRNPKKQSMVPIACEMNISFNANDKRIAGAFVKDDTGGLYVVHRGKIGGGRKGIGKSLFFDNYRGKWVTIKGRESDSNVALVGSVNSSRFINQVHQFIYEVERIKSLPRQEMSKANLDMLKFNDEFTGKKAYTVIGSIEAECDHGLVVNALSAKLKDLDSMVGNDRNRDLYIVDSKNKITTVFEIKTDNSTTSIYLAIGQLLLNNIGLTNTPKLVLVIPEKPGRETEDRLKKLGLNFLVFRWKGNKVKFSKLDTFK